jgi:hypothetical protein
MITGLTHVDSFLAKMAPTAKAIGRQWNIPPSVIIAQAALETGWGQAVKGNAYFGIKQGASRGETISFTTHEIVDGQRVAVVDRFRAYRSMQEATQAYAEFLHETPRYRNALRQASAPEKFVEALQEAGYATDPRYAEKLKQIIQRYQLTAYDEHPPTTPPPDAPEPSPRARPKNGGGWLGGITTFAKYLTVPARPELRQANASAAARPASTPAASEAEPATAHGRLIAAHQPPAPASSPGPETPSHRALPPAEFPRLLWEQVRQFAWVAGWSRPTPDRPADDHSGNPKSLPA